MTDSKQVSFTNWDDIPMEQLNELLGRKMITGEKCMLAQVFLKKDCVVPMHQHENEQLTYILEGKLNFYVGSEEAEPITLGVGGVLVIPSNTPHKAVALEDTLDLDVFSPPRQDWLQKTDGYLRK